MEQNVARVIRKNVDRYNLEDIKTNEMFFAILKGNVKSNKRNILVGDTVAYEKMSDVYVITKILERKNSLIRPAVANIDNLIITLSIKDPVIDYNLLDKELILCFASKIEPIICINKIDLKDETNKAEIEYIKSVYGKICDNILFTSAKDDIQTDKLCKLLKGKISAFSGNSGVGKSSLISKLSSNDNLEIGDIAKKTKKGRHTTKSVTLYKIAKDTYIVDTPGFSSYEIYNIEACDLKKYYPEFHNNDCDFDDCNHINEGSNVCAIKRDIDKNIIDRARYTRYVSFYNKLKAEEMYKYK